jgi:hypothetical protein
MDADNGLTDEGRQDWARFWFFVFETALLAAFFFNEVLPRWYVRERLGRGGIRPSAMFWSHLFNSLYHLDGPKPHPIYAIVYWVSLAGLLAVCGCFCWRRRDGTLVWAALISAVVTCGYILVAPRF